MIYFIECSGRVKIGFSLDPKNRLSKVSADSPFPCSLLGAVDGDRNEEFRLHGIWSHLHAHREWFILAADLREWIDGNVFDPPASLPHRGKKTVCGVPVKHGMKKAIAAGCGVTPATVSQWHKIPAEYCGVVSKITGVPISQIRPDIFPGVDQSTVSNWETGKGPRGPARKLLLSLKPADFAQADAARESAA